MSDPSKTNLVRLAIRLLLLAVLALVIVSCVGALLWWQHFKTTPTYSLALLVDAAQRNDMAAFDELFDTDQVVDNFVADAAGQSARDYAAVLPTSVRDQIAQIAKSGKQQIRPIIRELVLERIRNLGGESTNRPFILVALATRYKTKVIEDGDKARATIVNKDKQLELSLERRSDHRWTVISFKDDELAAGIIARIAKDLPGKLTTEGLPKLPTGLLPSLIP